MTRAPRATATEMRRALMDIMLAARDPHKLAAPYGATDVAAFSFALGWIESLARGVLGAPPPIDGWLALKTPERPA